MNQHRVKILYYQLTNLLGKKPTLYQWRVWKKHREVIDPKHNLSDRLDDLFVAINSSPIIATNSSPIIKKSWWQRFIKWIKNLFRIK